MQPAAVRSSVLASAGAVSRWLGPFRRPFCQLARPAAQSGLALLARWPSQPGRPPGRSLPALPCRLRPGRTACSGRRSGRPSLPEVPVAPGDDGGARLGRVRRDAPAAPHGGVRPDPDRVSGPRERARPAGPPPLQEREPAPAARPHDAPRGGLQGPGQAPRLRRQGPAGAGPGLREGPGRRERCGPPPRAVWHRGSG